MALTFDALGTYVHLDTRLPRHLAEAGRLAAEVLAEVDRTCSRFRDDSDLTRVNRHPDTWVEVDPLLVAAVEVAVDAARATGGLVHPLLGRTLAAWGYDRDFARLAELEAEPEGALTPPAPTPPLDAWRHVTTRDGAEVRIPPRTALDLGSTGKAWAADLVATVVAGELGAGAVVSVGGDVAVAAPDGEPWPVAVSERPGEPAHTTIGLAAGGLATSSTRVRRWARAGVARHHLIDPRTGRPAAEHWTTVTATGPTCVAANAASTAAIVLGAEAVAWLDERQVSACLVDRSGAITSLGTWPAPGAWAA